MAGLGVRWCRCGLELQEKEAISAEIAKLDGQEATDVIANEVLYIRQIVRQIDRDRLTVQFGGDLQKLFSAPGQADDPCCFQLQARG